MWLEIICFLLLLVCLFWKYLRDYFQTPSKVSETTKGHTVGNSSSSTSEIKDDVEARETKRGDTVIKEDRHYATEVKGAHSYAEQLLQIDKNKNNDDAQDTKGSDRVSIEDKQCNTEVNGAKLHPEKTLTFDDIKHTEDAEDIEGNATVMTEEKQDGVEVKGANSHTKELLPIDKSKKNEEAEDIKGSGAVITQGRQDDEEVNGAKSHAGQLLPMDKDKDDEDKESTIGRGKVVKEDRQDDTDVNGANSHELKCLPIDNSKKNEEAEDINGSGAVITQGRQDDEEVNGAKSHAGQLLPMDKDKDDEDTESTIGRGKVVKEDRQDDTEVNGANSHELKCLPIDNEQSKKNEEAEDINGSGAVITQGRQDDEEVNGAKSHAGQLLPMDKDKDDEDTESTIGRGKVVKEDRQDDTEVNGANSHELKCLPIDNGKATEDTENTKGSDIVGIKDEQVNEENSYAEKTLKIDEKKPGKPVATKIKAYSLELFWEQPEAFVGGDHYQVRYKDVNSGNKWKFIPNEYTHNTITVTERKANTKYIFKVRMVKDDEEGPYSEESDEVCTDDSPGARLRKLSTLVTSGTPSIYALPLTELSRCGKAKLRTFEIGSSQHIWEKEKTIMLVGATGTGKSTIVDGFVNHILDVNWNDPFRFNIVSLEEEERQRMGNKALSLTEWITCYTINPEKGSSLDYRLNIIDTPGFGDTRGLDRDQEIVEQIRELLSTTSGKGVTCIDAVCFLNKAPDARLTATQKYIYHSIMSLFAQDIEKNICSLITFADGQTPPVIASLKEADLPFGTTFTFNNSGLFSTNTQLDSSSLSPIFWEMGVKSYRAFFEYLSHTETKSLCLTKQVLDERQKLQLTISSLQPQVDAGLSKLSALEQEVKIIQQHESDINDNKDFEYETEEPRIEQKLLKKGHFVTNCLHCHITCHDDCVYANDEDKRKCCAIDSDGNCTICSEKCNWQQHKNMPYIFEFSMTKVKHTYQEKLKRYQDATGQKLNAEQVLKKMNEELNELEKGIQMLMAEVNESNNRLKEIALRPNPLSMVDHLDLMIKSEKMEMKAGFQGRITKLMDYKKKAQIGKDVERFTKQVMQTRREESEKDKDHTKGKRFSMWPYLKKLNVFSK